MKNKYFVVIETNDEGPSISGVIEVPYLLDSQKNIEKAAEHFRDSVWGKPNGCEMEVMMTNFILLNGSDKVSILEAEVDRLKGLLAAHGEIIQNV